MRGVLLVVLGLTVGFSLGWLVFDTSSDAPSKAVVEEAGKQFRAPDVVGLTSQGAGCVLALHGLRVEYAGRYAFLTPPRRPRCITPWSIGKDGRLSWRTAHPNPRVTKQNPPAGTPVEPNGVITLTNQCGDGCL